MEFHYDFDKLKWTYASYYSVREETVENVNIWNLTCKFMTDVLVTPS